MDRRKDLVGGRRGSLSSRPRLKLLALSLAALALAAVVVREPPVPKPDFSTVTTRAAADKLVREGALVRIHLFPTELGGRDDPNNIGYITPQAEKARQLAIGTIGRQIEQDLVDRMDVVPDYRAGSVVPTRIAMRAWHSERAGSIEMAVEIW